MSVSRSLTTSRQSQNEILILLSGEENSLPEAEAQALVKAYDERAILSQPEPRIILAKTKVDPDLVARRIAFARRVGVLFPDGRLDRETKREVEKASFRLRHFRLGESRIDTPLEAEVLNQLQGRVDLEKPAYELSVIEGRMKSYLVLSRPWIMSQGWVERRPRTRTFFHPSAIFPKLSRALVNLSGAREGETLLDPFAGTGSILLEASIIGLRPVGVDASSKMARGALANARRYGQSWLGMIRADATSLPLRVVDAIVTDVPYGRASSTLGEDPRRIIEGILREAALLLRRGGVAVLMHPSSSPIRTSDFAVESEHRLYIHRNLTRTITVLRR